MLRFRSGTTNDQIRELSAIATALPGIITAEQYMDKFAELIVKECIDVISPYAVSMENFD